jgi:hypothetical protein
MILNTMTRLFDICNLNKVEMITLFKFLLFLDHNYTIYCYNDRGRKGVTC